MKRSEPKWHTPVGSGGVLCGSNSVAAIMRTSDCTKCADRLDKILVLLIDIADGKAGQPEASALLKKFSIRANEELNA